MSEPAAKALTGTEGGQYPFWSPGRTLDRFLRAQLAQKGRCERPQSSGSACHVSVDPLGGAWLVHWSDCLRSPSNREPMSEFPATGGEPMPVFSDRQADAGGHRLYPMDSVSSFLIVREAGSSQALLMGS